MHRKFARLIPAILSLAVLTAIVATVWRHRRPELPPLSTLASFQDADAPLSMPADGHPDFRFDRFSAPVRTQIPLALRFAAPIGSESAALAYNAQPFWEMNAKRGGHHTGDDLNGIGGMDSDLGDPVFAVADGLVVFAGLPSPGWGNVVILAHRLADGRVLQSYYAHLEKILVPLGGLVGREGKIGTVGTANGNYPAHLHFEIREAFGVEITGAYRDKPLDCLPPMPTLTSLGMNSGPDIHPSPLAILLHSKKPNLSRIQFSGNVERAVEAIEKSKN